tara:strand:- start:2167 stop:2586 length:420 start_codon:yes stop_codon:yes gene_type:complete
MSMIENVRYLGIEIKKSSFERFEIESEGGTYGLEATTATVNIHVAEEGSDESVTFFSIPVNAKVWGEDKQTKEKVFVCDAYFEVDFALEERDELADDAIANMLDSNEWYFRNFVAISVKTALESVLKNTSFSSIEIPLK